MLHAVDVGLIVRLFLTWHDHVTGMLTHSVKNFDKSTIDVWPAMLHKGCMYHVTYATDWSRTPQP